MAEYPLTPKKKIGDRIRQSDRSQFVNPNGPGTYYLHTDEEIGSNLINIDKLINQRHFGQALKHLDELKVPESPFHEHYKAQIVEKKIKTFSRIASIHGNKSNLDQSKTFFQKALGVSGDSYSTTDRILKLADSFFDEQVRFRGDVINDLLANIQEDVYEKFCESKKILEDSSLLNNPNFRLQIDPYEFVDIEKLREWLEGDKGEIIPGKNPNWVDPADMPPEMWGLDLDKEAVAQPGSKISFGGEKANFINVDPTVHRSPERVRSSFAMPLIYARLIAHAGLFAKEHNVDFNGQKQRSIPLYRYSFLREQVLALLDRIGSLEQKMLFLQDSVDDFAELISHLQKPLTDMRAELASLEKQITGGMQLLTELASTESELSRMTQELKKGVDDCDVEWWEYLLAVVIFIGLVVTGVVLGGLGGAALGGYLGGKVGAGIGIGVGVFGGFTAGAFTAFEAIDALEYWDGAKIDCNNVESAYSEFNSALTQVKKALTIGSVELQVALANRDVLQAQIAALSSQLQGVYHDNASRHLNADTIENILEIYEDTRRRLIDQATILAKKMEASYHFEFGESWQYLNRHTSEFIANSYSASKGKGYGAREQLLKDIESLEYLRLNSRNHKVMQLTLNVSLRKHYPSTFIGLKTGAKAPFTLSMEDMDQFYPGTYQHRIKEVQVQVITDGIPSTMRGYLSCYGPSQIRFQDIGNKFKVDQKDVFAEPDSDIAKLCYKRTWQVGGRESMAFPDLSTPRAKDRMVTRQRQERNFFENLGMGVTWVIEILPDQNFDMTHVSDVIVTFQIEAEYDENLRRAIEKKRFDNREEVAVFSAKKLIERQQRKFDLADLEFDIHQTSLPYGYQEKEIKHIGLFVKPKSEQYINGSALISLQLQSEPAVQIKTDKQGRGATGTKRNAGPNGKKLAAAFHGKNPVGRWKLSIADLPVGVKMNEIDDIYLLVKYKYTKGNKDHQ